MTAAPDLLGEVYGVRGWLTYPVTMPGGGHAQILRDWVPGVNVAYCRYGHPHQAPDLGCTCGLYAYYGGDRFGTLGSYGEVRGLVRGWGRVAVAGDGWRAQYAEVVAVDAASPDAEEIARAYGVPTMSFEEMNLLASHNTVPSTLRPRPLGAVISTHVPVQPQPVRPATGAHRRLDPVHAELWCVLAATVATVGLWCALALGAGGPVVAGLGLTGAAALCLAACLR